MHNQYEYSEESETLLVKKNLDNLCKFLKKLNNDDDWQRPHKYTIIEYFPYDNHNVQSVQYNLINLTIDIENDGIAYCDDGEGILEEAMYNNSPLRLQTIIIDHIINIGHQDNILTISMDDGYIKIIY